MGRTVSYSVVKRNNPLDQDAVPKFYAQAQANGHVEIREMADRIQKTCYGDACGCYGCACCLGGCDYGGSGRGRDRKACRSGHFPDRSERKRCGTEDTYDVSMIRKARINFRPGIALSGILAALKYTKVDKLPVKRKGSKSLLK